MHPKGLHVQEKKHFLRVCWTFDITDDCTAAVDHCKDSLHLDETHPVQSSLSSKIFRRLYITDDCTAEVNNDYIPLESCFHRRVRQIQEKRMEQYAKKKSRKEYGEHAVNLDMTDEYVKQKSADVWTTCNESSYHR